MFGAKIILTSLYCTAIDEQTRLGPLLFGGVLMSGGNPVVTDQVSFLSHINSHTDSTN